MKPCKNEKNPTLLSVSMMCVKLNDLRDKLQLLETGGVDFLHVDVMDGSFVPNYALGTDYIRELRKLSKLPLDIHLMIDQPENKLDWFNLQPTDMVSIHYESTVHVHRALSKIKQCGCQAVLALNPATPLSVVEELLDSIDGILIMTVNPGFAGQQIVESCIKKVGKLRKILDSAGYSELKIEVDGNISEANAKRLRMVGADMFVLGSSSILGSDNLELESRIFKKRIG